MLERENNLALPPAYKEIQSSTLTKIIISSTKIKHTHARTHTNKQTW